MSLDIHMLDPHMMALLILRGQDLMVVVALLLLVFGGKKLPELAKGLGESIRNFKTSIKEEDLKPEEKKEAKTEA
jgi:sec-independent protein translocase protein TatA